MMTGKAQAAATVVMLVTLLLQAMPAHAMPHTSVPGMEPWSREIYAAGAPIPDSATERDAIFMLLAYAIVYADWQNGDMSHNRGYNIGCVLVDRNGTPVYAARNNVNFHHDRTQHGEVRAITGYLCDHPGTDNLKDGYTIYTTLEPCAMCSGMMMLTSLPRTVWGQKDPSYGDALERLELNSTACARGYPPYPRFVRSDGSQELHRYWLDAAFDRHRKATGNDSITSFLATDEAKAIFRDAAETLFQYRVRYPENQRYVDEARALFATMPGACCTERAPQSAPTAMIFFCPAIVRQYAAPVCPPAGAMY